MQNQEIINLLHYWLKHPEIFVEQVFNVMTYDKWLHNGALPDVPHQEFWQTQGLRDLATDPRLAFKSGKGVGKTTFLSWVVLWGLGVHVEVKLPCTATSGHQLNDVLWPECKKWIDRVQPQYKSLLRYVWKSEYIQIEGYEQARFAVARTSRKEQPEALQGFHAKKLIFIVDEASGVDDAVFEKAEGGMSTHGAQVILTGNPTRTTGYFYDAFNKDSRRWKCRTVSCTDVSIVSKDYCEYMAKKWGVESNEYRIGVLGEFPLGSHDTIIPMHLIQQAVNRPLPKSFHPEVWGVDVSRFGNDRTAIAFKRGRIMPKPVQWWQGLDLMQTAGRIAEMYFTTPVEQRPVEVCVDTIGVGAGVYDRLRELELPVLGVNVAERKSIRPGYTMLRDDLWFQAREWFEDADCCMVDDPDLIEELAAIEYEFDSYGRRKVKNKHTLGWSPDLADAFVMTFASYKGKYTINAPLASNKKPMYAQSDATYMEEYYQ